MSYKKHWRIAMILLVVGLLAFGTSLVALAGIGYGPTDCQQITPTQENFHNPGNAPLGAGDPVPGALQAPYGCTLKGFKVDLDNEDLVNGVYKVGDSDTASTDETSKFQVEITKSEDNKTFTWESNMPVFYVWVKGSSEGGNLYNYYETYPEGVFLDCGLSQPGGDWSHITFFYCEIPLYNICGYKFDADTGEGIEGWKITLKKLEGETWVFLREMDTGVNGRYCFTGLRAGNYRVTEEVKENWKNISPLSYDVEIPQETADDETFERDFENAPLYRICGYKFDADTEEGIKDWKITLEKLGLDGETWSLVKEKYTDDDGMYCFTELRAGTYRVTEEEKVGWINVSPLSYTVEIPIGEEAGAAYGEDFYNRPVHFEPSCETAWAYDPGKNIPFTELGLGNWGWTNGIYDEGEYVLELWAGAGKNNFNNGTQVGTVTVNYSGSTVTVTYQVDQGYTIEEAHLYIGRTPLPMFLHGRTDAFTNAPGQFPYKEFDLSGDGRTATFVIEGIDYAFYVAAHAVVCGDFEDNGEHGEGLGMPAKHDGMTGREFGEAVSDLAKSTPGAVADHVLEQKGKERPEKPEPPEGDEPDRGRP